MRKFQLLLLLMWTGSLSAQDSTLPVVAPGAVIQLVSAQFKFTEGAAVNKKGDVFLRTSLMIRYGNIV
ncbi:hypothetical protein MKQ70_24400 [Chitinophaga sedimenti]|uniref:hypothetical protein n=1 Tax=Chitinophaga sedimenti TaxID=2033606 RepID=UPI0020045C18|nr:hypothetical protein [Chitinophaga sedimenti]MCK7557978.1 hypothetical protein [Chitinophaga sedimenti]